ncbi:hypothetical protein JFU47_01720 [Pseudomonas sp. TH39(2020)]|uniref:hypothetical protein n=1 Tax=Pseudomonas sp. TH39(2020) TaxID=2796349 RepID=UPI001912E63C|nr:hypothetical protein [Pseudomonas sp. TH39(2020)]MBK5395466.1 hypothetical protein [Pseudomonas sp. TH39(2020)]
MNFSMLCDEPPVQVCPPKFRLRASGWIDSTNIGDNKIGTPPPQGIRLRWNCPFLEFEAMQRPGKPLVYEVQRSRPFDQNSLWLPSPSAGHLPRTPTPRELWQPLGQENGNDFLFSVEGDPCRGVDAVYFEMPANHRNITVTLITTSGASKVSGEVTGGDKFYFELADIKVVAFSGPCQVQKVMGLFLGAGAGDGLEFMFEPIAWVDAERWINTNLDEISERIATQSGTPYVDLTASGWAEVQIAGRQVWNALETGAPLPTTAIDTVQLASALRWESATLMGWGFIDGEHPANPIVDQIRLDKMLSVANDQVYAYRVVAVLKTSLGTEKRWPSIPAFAWARHAPQLSPVVCRAHKVPLSQMKLSNWIDIGQTPLNAGPAPRQRIYCSTSWELETELPMTELIFTRPVGDDSALTGETFKDPGEFTTGSNRVELSFRGLALVQHRNLKFEVPYFDSDIGLALAAGDSWDRKMRLEPSPRIQPRIDYEGICIPIGSAKCNGNLSIEGYGNVAIELDQKIAWEADPLAAYGGKIALLMQHPRKTVFEADVEIGPAFLTLDGDWSTEINSKLTQADLNHFIGGMLTVEGLTARIKAIGRINSGRVLCTFEVATKCGGAMLYLTPNGQTVAHLREDPQADRLWIVKKTIDVLETGLPAKYTEEIELHMLDHSMMLAFATRLIVKFEDKTYRGPITTLCQAPYIHPAPKPPQTCFSVDQIATDFYGRQIVRVVADRCPQLNSKNEVLADTGQCAQHNPDFKVRATMAPGENLSTKDYLANRSEGLFGAQAIFERQHLFEGFDDLARQPEAGAFTVGLSYVREADGRESEATLQSFTARRIE